MITVSISINGEPIFARTARNIKNIEDGYSSYDVDDGRTLKHKREDGAIKLAIQMLEGIKEP